MILNNRLDGMEMAREYIRNQEKEDELYMISST